MDDAECPPFYAKSTGIQGRITRWQDIEYHAPCLYLLHSRIAPVGVVPEEDGSDPNGFHTEITYAITPSSDGKVYDFWAVSATGPRPTRRSPSSCGATTTPSS